MTKAILVDWGTTNCRIWVVLDDGAISTPVLSDRGMSVLTADQYEEVLIDLVGDYLGADPVPVVICGMAGAQGGWKEARYQTVPCAPNDLNEILLVSTQDRRLKVKILAGVAQNEPADVMRGEETQISGFLADVPAFDGVICLPGTHTKWVHVSAEEIVSFRTFMTGELFSLISKNSVLAGAVENGGWLEEAFLQGVDDAISRPELIASRLFALRAEHILQGSDSTRRRSRLSGLLIGAEIAAAKPYWLGQDLVLIGESELCEVYRTALASVGQTARAVDAEAATVKGLLRALCK